MKVAAIGLVLLCACGSVKASSPDAPTSSPPDGAAGSVDAASPGSPDAGPPDAGPPDAGPPPGLRVFITEAIYTPSELGGVDGADGLCQSAATSAGLGGSWMAWLASSTSGPATRFTTRSTDPYVRLDGARIADDWADLTDGTIQSEIDLTPNGAVPNGNNVWSNVAKDGTPLGSTDCGEWADNSKPSGHYGRSNVTSLSWTDSGSYVVCGNYQLHLYCFEQ
jgi:hypothetical protein